MRIIKKQIIFFLLSLWGMIAWPLGYLRELGEDKIIPIYKWLQYILGIITVCIVWGWFLPALGFSKVMGILDSLYEVGIFPLPKNRLGWILPIIIWFLIFNVFNFVIINIKKRINSPKS